MASEENDGEKETGETVSENNGSEDAGEGTEGTETEEPLEEAAEDVLTEQAEGVAAETFAVEGGETSGSCGENVTWEFEDGVLTISGSGAMYNYFASAKGDVPWYEYRDNIKRTVVEEGVSTIGDRAFNECSSLTSIELPSGITTIGNQAFSGCRGLTSIELPTGIMTIGHSAFSGCSSLTSIELPSRIKTIENYTFRDCSSLTRIELPSGITSIETLAFGGCISLTSIKIPSGVTSMGGGAFEECSNLTRIELPSGITVIPMYTFNKCNSLTSIEIPFGITVIDEFAFDACSSLKDVYYGGSESDWRTITIGNYNESLTSATLHCALNDSESDDLKWNLDMNGVLTISGTGKMADYHEPDSPAPWSGQRDQIKTVIISQGVTSIGASAFLGCTNLTEITIPKSVVSIGDSAFSGCENLARVRFLGTKEQLESITVGTDNEPYYKASRSWIEGGSNDPDIYTSTAVFERKIPFYPWYSGKKEIPMDWGWDLVLKGKSQEYDNSLAKIALALSGASEHSQTSVEELLKIKLEVDSDLVLSRNYDLDWYAPGYPGVTFGHKTIRKKNGENEHVIIAVVRGTTNPVDIRTDLSLGGFSQSAVNITKQLEEYVEACSLNTGEITKDNVKFFIMGHSLGGAVANLVAHGLNGTYGIGNVFAYTFAAPLSTNNNDSYSGNIHNIVNVEDYVPHLTNDFSSCRYGNDWWFYREASPKMYDAFWANFDQSLKSCISKHRIMGHHAVETYLSCLLTGDDVAWKQISVGKASVCCPVDVKVYNGAGELVGSIIDNRVEEETLSDGVVLYVSGEDGDEKYVLFLTEDTYRLEISAVDGGTMAYTIQYVDMSAEEVLQEKEFQNVALTSGKQMTSSVSVWDKTNPDISVEDKIDTPQVQLLVLDENDNIVREVLPDGSGTEIPYTGPNEVLPGDIPAGGKIPDGLWIAGVADFYPYTGAAIKPEIRVYDGKKKLQPGKDYTASYKNNTKANDAANPSTAPSVVVRGKGNYTGTETATFKITAVGLSDDSISVEDITAAYNKKVQKKTPVLTYNGRKLAKNRDFTVSYPSTGTDAYKESGTYEILLTAKAGGNFSGTRVVKCIITDNTLLAKVNVKKIPNQAYTGKAIEPELMVTYKNAPLIRGTDYLVSYTDHTEIGTAKAVLTGIGKYAGTKSVSFKITGTSLKGAALSGVVNQTYNGSYQRQGMTVVLHGRTLVEGTDYEVDYANNKDVGKASVTIKGKGAYTGTVKKTFQIGKFDIAANRDGRFTAEVKQETIPYAKGGAKPTVAVRFRTGDGRWQTLVEGRDYTLSYRNHTAVNDGSKADRRPAVTVKGKGSFCGTYGTVLSYKIMAQDIGQLTLKAQDKTYQNRKNVFATKVAVTDLDGKVLKAGTDYNKTAVYT